MKIQYKKTPVWLVAIALTLLCVRLALPYGVKWYANRVLDKNKDYKGKIETVDLHLWRGAYSIHGIEIQKVNGKTSVPFFKTEKLDLSLSWKDLIHGKVKARLEFDTPEVNFTDGESKAEKQSGKEANWGKMLDELAPFEISRLIVEKGAVHFRNVSAKPPVDIWIKEMRAEVENLTNAKGEGQDLFAKAWVEGLAMGNGKLDVQLQLNPRAEKPTFELNAKLLGLDLTRLNAFFKKYALLDFERGNGDIVTQISSQNGVLNGYVKPLFKNVDVFSFDKDSQKNKSVFALAWEALADGVVTLLKNQPKDQFATKIPVKGKIDAPESDILAMLGGVLSNAFVQAFSPFYDNSITIKKVRTVSN